MKILGIDPGLSGAWAVLSEFRIYNTDHLPLVGEGAQRRIDAASFAALIDEYTPDIAVIEDVSAMPGQGVSSMFRFGRAVGALEGVLLAKGVPFHRVQPARWKKHFRLVGKVKGSGEPSRQRAIERWPRHIEFFTRQKDSQRAEAALIALWFLEQLPPTQEAA